MLRRAAGYWGLLSAALFLLLTLSFSGQLYAQSICDSPEYVHPGPPLMDLGPGVYRVVGDVTYIGGLYPGGSSVAPLSVRNEAAARAQRIREACQTPGERVVLMSIGVSNTSDEYMEFLKREMHPSSGEREDQLMNPCVLLVNGAEPGAPASCWADPDTYCPPDETPWVDLATMDANDDRWDASMVRAVWIKHASGYPTRPPYDGTFPLYSQTFQGFVETVIRRLKDTYPNLEIAFMSSRTHAFADRYPQPNPIINPEPFAYETGFSVRWMIEKQQSGHPDLNYNPALGQVEAPLLMWSAYIWADNEPPRSDGLVWLPEDTASDCTHPAQSGQLKVADQLTAYFKTNPAATPWFLDDTRLTGSCTIAPVTTGTNPLTVQFAVNHNLSSPSELAVTYGDGGFAYSDCAGGCPAPTKSFPVAGVYHVHATVTDTGNRQGATCSTIIYHAATPLPGPAGAVLAATPLLLARDADGAIAMTWGASCRTGDADFAFYRGDLGDFTTHEPVTCSTGQALSITVPLPPDDSYFLVAPLSADSEGSHGLDGDGNERAPDAITCAPQDIGPCD